MRKYNSLQAFTAETLHRHVSAVLARDPAIERRSTAFVVREPVSSAPIDVSSLLKIDDPIEFVRKTYVALLSRNPDEAELNRHLHELSTLSRAYVLERITTAASAANPQLSVCGRWQRRNVVELLTLQGSQLVNEAFRTILWRAPTFEEHVRYLWAVDRLGSAKAFLAELASVPEARRYPPLATEISDLTSIQPREAFIARAYQDILGRDPDSEGFRAAMAALRWMPRVRYLKALAASAEAESRPVILFWHGRPIQRRSLYATARLTLATLVDSLLAGLYRRTISVEMHVAAVANAQTALRDDLAQLQTSHRSLHAAVEAVHLEAGRKRDRQERESEARFEAARRSLWDMATENKKKYERRIEAITRAVHAVAAREDRVIAMVRDVSNRPQTPVVPVGDRLLVSRVQGYVMAMPAEDVLLTSMLTMYGSIDAGLNAFFGRVLQPGMIFVDVGAHIGLHTLRAASVVGDGGCVYSFEPAPRLFDILTTNIVLNGFSGRVVTERKAVSQFVGRSRFIVKQQTGLNTLFGQQGPGDNVIEVETVSLDEALHTLPRIDMVKIDAEGAEAEILRGMTRLLTIHPNMQLVSEFAPSLLRRAGVDPFEFISDLNGLGFRISRIDDMTGEAKSTSAEELLQLESSNVLLARV